MSEKKGLWGSIKGAFVEDIPDASGTPQQEPDGRQEPAPSIPAQVGFQPAVDLAARQRLEAAIAEASPPGYQELQDILSTLSDSIPDEGARWKAALKLAAKRGHTVEALRGDFDKCIGILESKERQFDDETQTQLKKRVASRQEHIASIDREIKSHQEKIQNLQAEISQLSERRGSESAAMVADERKIHSVAEGFYAAYKAVHADVSAQREKLSAFGKAVTP